MGIKKYLSDDSMFSILLILKSIFCGFCCCFAVHNEASLSKEQKSRNILYLAPFQFYYFKYHSASPSVIMLRVRRIFPFAKSFDLIFFFNPTVFGIYCLCSLIGFEFLVFIHRIWFSCTVRQNIYSPRM